MASMKCPLCGNLDAKPVDKDEILYYSDHPVKALNPEVLCENSGKPHAWMEWFILSGQSGERVVVWPGKTENFKEPQHD